MGCFITYLFESAISSHLDNIKQRDIVKVKRYWYSLCSISRCVLFFLKKDIYASVQRIIEHGLPIALATCFNPSTWPCGNMQMIIILTCLKMGYHPFVQTICAASDTRGACYWHGKAGWQYRNRETGRYNNS